MRYAIISDIHGNEPALKTVLEDAKSRNVEGYIVVGDYCLSNPYPNECITTIKHLENAYIIRGNEESYLADKEGNHFLHSSCYRNLCTVRTGILAD